MAAPVEIQFAQKLAANEPKIRDRAVKKLKKWLTARSSNSGPGLGNEEMLRIWKGLHYCFWMSDKPLIQEELAENIGSLIHCFSADSQTALKFSECFLITLGREWFGIDRWRMDKFMMLARRVLRQIFVYIARQDWNEDLVSKFAEIYERKTILQEKSGSYLGFQLHFIDIFLEELAKIGGEELPSKVISEILLKPFIKGIADGKTDSRLVSHIEVRIFRHLMRQSDIGIAYEEGAYSQGHEKEEENEEEGEENEKGSGEEEEEMDIENEEFKDNNNLDPRAGKVDVILPQLQVDFAKLSDLCFEAGSDKKVPSSRRLVLYRLTKHFKQLAAEEAYPLAIELPDFDEIRKKKIKVKKLAERKAKEELKLFEKNREEKLKYREIMKNKLKAQREAERRPGDEENDDDDDDEEEEMEEEPASPVNPKVESPKKDGKKQPEMPGGKSIKQSPIKVNKKRKRPLEEEKLDSDDDDEIISKPDVTPSKKKKGILEEDVDNSGSPKYQKELKLNGGNKKKTAENDTGSDKKKKNQINDSIIDTSMASESDKKKRKKKKKNKDQSNSSISDTSITSASSEPVSPNDDAASNKKKKNQSKDETITDISMISESGTKKKKKKKNKVEDTTSETGNKTDESLQETEILLPNLKYNVKASVKTPEKKTEKKSNDELPTVGLNGFDPPKILSNPKLPVPIFVKKSAKLLGKKKKEVIKKKETPESLKRKRVNFAITQNKHQSVIEHNRSIIESPEIPYVPEKKPKQGVLKVKTDTIATPSPPTNPKLVQRNTILNGKSKAAKFFVRAAASDFF